MHFLQIFLSDFQQWLVESEQLHECYAKLVHDRIDFRENYFEEDKARLAGIEYALETTGLYSMREEVEKRRFKDVVKPFFVEVNRILYYPLLSIL